MMISSSVLEMPWPSIKEANFWLCLGVCFQGAFTKERRTSFHVKATLSRLRHSTEQEETTKRASWVLVSICVFHVSICPTVTSSCHHSHLVSCLPCQDRWTTSQLKPNSTFFHVIVSFRICLWETKREHNDCSWIAVGHGTDMWI